MEGPKNMPDEEPGELERLAEDWIALWQSEISALAVDREMAEAWGGWAAATAGWWRAAMAAAPQAAMPPMAMPMMRGWPFPMPGGGPGGPHEQPGPAARPAPPAPSPGAGDDTRPGGDGDDAALRRRLERLEQRLADLEGGPGGSGADRRRPRRRAPSA